MQRTAEGGSKCGGIMVARRSHPRLLVYPTAIGDPWLRRQPNGFTEWGRSTEIMKTTFSVGGRCTAYVVGSTAEIKIRRGE